MSNVCPKCGSSLIERRVVQNINHNPPHDITYHHESVCGACYHVFQTLFDRITASPEELAEKLVYIIISEVDARFDGYTSNIVPSVFETTDEAIAATVAKLKEVYSG